MVQLTAQVWILVLPHVKGNSLRYTLKNLTCFQALFSFVGSVSQYSIRLDYAATPLPNSPSLTGTVEECRDTCDRNLNCVSFTYYSATSACYINFIGSSLTVTQTTGYNYYEKDYMAETSGKCGNTV